MRLISKVWISALVRRVSADGGFAHIVKSGATEAGVVFIALRNKQQLFDLYAPAQQSAYETSRPADRQFQLVAQELSQNALDDKIEKERRFDPDVWFVELEALTLPLESYFDIIE